MANIERTMRSVSGVQRCRLSNLQACRVGILLVVAATFCLNASVVEGQACGVANGGSTCEQGNCCSQYNNCGNTSAHCGAGCQLEYSPIGACDDDPRNGPASPPGSTTPECGKSAGNRWCDGSMCCSRHGYCGTSGDYCYSTRGCQSQCRPTPGKIAGITLGIVVGAAIVFAICCGWLTRCDSHQMKKFAINRGSITPVHRLFPEVAAEDKDTCVDIILCHGFAIGDLQREVWKNTWQTTRLSFLQPVVCWPEVWLGRDLPEGKARVFALEYDANISSDPQRKGYHTDVSEIAQNLLHSLFEERHENIGQSNAVVLIGHSFGGLVIKSLVVEAQSLAHQKARNALDRVHAARCQNFVKNIRGFIFYAVPHSGAQNLEVYIKTLFRWYNRRPAQESHHPQGTLLSNIAEFSRKMEDLNVQFEALLGSGVDDLPVFNFIEGLPMSEAVGKIVEDDSAIRLSKRNHYKVESANHFSVCRPSTRDHASYQKLLSVLNPIVEASPSSHRTTEQFDIEKNHGSEHSESQSLLHPGKIPSLPPKLTRLISSKPNDDDILPL